MSAAEAAQFVADEQRSYGGSLIEDGGINPFFETNGLSGTHHFDKRVSQN
jgi:hypothetical protein